MKKIFQIRLNLAGTDVWRRFQLSSDTSLTALHAMIQVMMGWLNTHQYEFSVGKKTFGNPVAGELEPGDFDCRSYKISDLEAIGPLIKYVYDFGDGWECILQVEATFSSENGRLYPFCMEGEKAGPFEDCGGVQGYQRLLVALKDKNNPEHADLLDWVGKEYDPDYFSAQEISTLWQYENHGMLAEYDHP